MIYSNEKDGAGKGMRYDVGAIMRKWWAENRNKPTVKEEPMQAVQDELTSFAGIYKLKVKISEDGSDDDESSDSDQSDDEKKKGKKVRKTKKGGSEEKKSKPKEKLAAEARKIPEEQRNEKPCALCVARDRSRYARGHTMNTCFDNPLCDWFEPYFGYDVDGNKKGTEAAKRAWEKRKKTLPGYTERTSNNSTSSSSGSGKRRYSEAEIDDLVEKKIKKLKADEEKADADFAKRIQEYEKSKGYVSVAPEELKKLRRARADDGVDADVGDKAQWKYHPITGEPM